MSFKSFPIYLLLMGALFIGGCAKTLEAPSGDKSITRGSTTLPQILKNFGKPLSVENGPDGVRKVIYQDHQLVTTVPANLQNPNTFQMRHLEILIDANAVVKDYLYSLGSQLQSGNALRTQWGKPISKNQLSQLTIGKSTREHVIALLGNPLFEGLEFDGGRGLNWMFTETIGEASVRVKHLKVRFDTQGLVAAYDVQVDEDQIE